MLSPGQIVGKAVCLLRLNPTLAQYSAIKSRNDGRRQLFMLPRLRPQQHVSIYTSMESYTITFCHKWL